MTKEEEILQKYIKGKIDRDYNYKDRKYFTVYLECALKAIKDALQQNEGQVNNLNKLVKAQQEYIDELSAELDDMAGLSFAHNFKSKRVKVGRHLRRKIRNLRRICQKEAAASSPEGSIEPDQKSDAKIPQRVDGLTPLLQMDSYKRLCRYYGKPFPEEYDRDKHIELAQRFNGIWAPVNAGET